MEIRWVGDVSRIEYKPTDKFVLSIDERISDETWTRLRKGLADFLKCPEDNIVVLVGGMKLGIMGEKT